MKPKIFVDGREDKNFLKQIQRTDLEAQIKQLVTADCIIYGEDEKKNEFSIGIERKTQTDFLNSIIDKRIITQLIELKRNFTVPLLIIEGQENMYRLRNFHPNAIRGMLTAIIIDLQIPILYTVGIKDTVAFITTITKRLTQPHREISLLKKRKPRTLKEQQEYIVESIPSIGPLLAKSLLKKFGSVKDIVNATEEELQEVEKVGKKKAAEVKRLMDSKYL